MELNLLPSQMPRGPLLGVALPARPFADLAERLLWASEAGFEAVTVSATGEPGGLHTPDVSNDERADLRERLTAFRAVSVEAPHQATFDVSLVSPSSAIRRASITELWSVCRFADAIGAGLVLARSGLPPMGTSDRDRDARLSESLTTLDKTAGERGIGVALWNRDRFYRLSDFDDLRGMPLTQTGLAIDVAHAVAIGETLEQIGAFVATHSERVWVLRVPSTPDVGDALVPALQQAGYRNLICFASGARNMADQDDIARARQHWARLLGQDAGETPTETETRE